MDIPPTPARAGSHPAGVDARHRRLVALSAWAGILGPILFTVAFLVQDVAHEFDPIVEPISALEAGPYGWIQQLNFVVFGLLTIAFAAGLHLGLRPTRAGIAGPVLLAVSGIGLLLAAVFPLREDAAGNTYDPGGHIIAGLTFFMTSATGLIVVSRRMTHDPRWTSISAYTRSAGVTALAGFLAAGVLVAPEDAPLHEWAGLTQRTLVILVLFPSRIALSVRLLRIGRVAASAKHAGR